MADHLPGRQPRLAIARMRTAGEGQFVQPVEFGTAERDRRRIEPDLALAVGLDQSARIARIGLQMEHARGMGIEHRVVAHLFEGRQPDHGLVALGARRRNDDRHALGTLLAARVVLIGIVVELERSGRVELGRVEHRPTSGRRTTTNEGRAAQIADGVDRFAARQTVRQLYQRPLGITVDEQVRLGIDQHRAAHRLRPVVEVRDAAQTGLDPADDDGHSLVGFACALRIDVH